MKNISIAITALFLILFFSCNDTGTKPVIRTQADTTSHAISWQVYNIGTYSSIINDVAVIDGNDIWAIGEIHTDSTDRWNKDSTEWLQPYNAAHWDGVKWELMHISPEFRGHKITPEIEGIFAFDTNNIWFCAGGAPVYWNGEKFTMYHLWDMGILGQTDGGVTKAWGTSSTNIFFVGRTGTIVHYDGKGWTKIESTTQIRLTDIWGSPDGSVVWACGFDEIKGSVLLKNNGNTFDTIVTYDVSNPHGQNLISYAFQSLWTNSADTVFIGSVGRVYKTPVNYTSYAPEMIWYDYANQTGYPNATTVIRGTRSNDLFVAGFQNEIRHYNGKSWHRYDEIMTNSGYWYALSITKNTVVAGGWSSQLTALIAIGTR